MNIAIGRKTFGRNTRSGIGLLLLGLSVAAISVAVLWERDSSSSGTVTEPVAAPAAVRPVEPVERAFTPVHYYLVDSDAQIDGFNQAALEAGHNFAGMAPGEDMYIIDLRTPEGQQLARALREDLYLQSTQANTSFDPALVQIHDLTAGASTSSSPARTSYQPAEAATQATIYIVGSEAQKQQLLNEADAAASFESDDGVLPVVVVIDASDPEAFQMEQAITEDNLNGGTGARVIDLR